MSLVLSKTVQTIQ